MVQMTVTAASVQLADGVYQEGSTLYIGSDVTSLGSLRVNPSVIYCYATIPPSLMNNTFTGYNAEVHVPAAGMVAYFTALYWYNFNNITADAIEPQLVTLNETAVELEQGGSVSLTATVAPSNATPSTVSWSSTNTAVATVSGGTVMAVAPGECDIIASCATVQAVCHVVVSAELVTITLVKHEARLLPNHTMTLYATCTPPTTDLAVTTSDPSVAVPRYVNGTIMVVGVSEGTATITVTTADGWAIPDACEVTVYTLLGDVNADGFVNVADVTMLISHILGTEPEGFNETMADVNHDSNLNVADVTTLIAYILGNVDLNPIIHEWVDLGLPSGTLWATCNIGANSPEEYGDYFAWGETVPKDYYNWSTYKWCNGSDTTLTKYCTNSSYGYNGFTDGKTELDLEDDAAYVNWGSSWRMPTTEQQQELINNCTLTWTQGNGVGGLLVTGPNGNILFLPAAGDREGELLYYPGLYGFYWSCSFYSSGPHGAGAYYLDFYSGYLYCGNDGIRNIGHTVRAVYVPQN